MARIEGRTANQARLFQTGTFLRDTMATHIEETIHPTIFQKDLYSVLGVSHGCSRQEIRQAYCKIAFSHHPDRNSTIEALSIFRNATYAYQILGKSDRVREEYDLQFDTVKNFSLLTDLCGLVVGPLAFCIVAPLLKQSFKSMLVIASSLIELAAEKQALAPRIAESQYP